MRVPRRSRNWPAASRELPNVTRFEPERGCQISRPFRLNTRQARDDRRLACHAKVWPPRGVSAQRSGCMAGRAPAPFHQRHGPPQYGLTKCPGTRGNASGALVLPSTQRQATEEAIPRCGARRCFNTRRPRSRPTQIRNWKLRCPRLNIRLMRSLA